MDLSLTKFLGLLLKSHCESGLVFFMTLPLNITVLQESRNITAVLVLTVVLIVYWRQ